MILVDANIPLYAEDSRSEHHAAIRAWWDARLSGSEPVALCWPVLTAFLRIGTNPRILRRPLTLREASARVQSWLDQPCVSVLQPSDQHWKIFQRLLHEGRATANLVSDAHLAALAVEHNCTLCSTDADFARFKSVKWQNPLDAE
ncbi:MAG: type II toxin-antitoxin system VapC family toxin [Opitutaceae bacterium]|nr:type II toxin-antitoxin system VapC family toxin [Opitutaceae bacterium]MBP9913920.1 type II toxin-antitoxin system VapC family toxin [Opitutaceae bacterium]